MMGSFEAVVLILAVTVVLLTPALIFGDGLTSRGSDRTTPDKDEARRVAGRRASGSAGC